MIDNTIIECNYCKTKIRLRFQLGYFNIPFDLRCPKCGVHLRGIRKFVDEESFQIDNATVIYCSLNEVQYYMNLSVELPSKKIELYESEQKILESGFSPFLSMGQLIEFNKYKEVAQEVNKFLFFRNSGWKQLCPLYDLLFSGSISLAKNTFLEYSSAYEVENELDATMALHQMTMFGINHILPGNELLLYISYSKIITKEMDLIKIIGFILEIGGTPYLSELTKKVITIYKRWFQVFEKYIPAIIFSLTDSMSKIDKKIVGISTCSVEETIAFYADSYETILDMIGIAIGLNNIRIRGDYNSFHIDSKLNNYKEFVNMTKSQRIKALVDEEPFSRPIVIERHIRNAIAHNNYEYDYNTQMIIFHDQHQGKENTVEIYLLELSMLCYENFKIIVYLNELLYNLKKIDYAYNGMIGHIKAITDDNNLGRLYS